ncbi:PD-(D/E)XK nuclease family protein [Xenorhabdus khoisanae]|uniref:PDDEXK-like family protein n=1 Tax=Xenorhabdus khoisanae TaxID=880157 RepID=UPI002358E0A7|nr:PD-(D/E)XK nuclease family protein [Xenorhabdus khoisanae]MDC9616091.1 PD-(D/E)XK nuclease family protein [Xenorhabdus khoisanae]
MEQQCVTLADKLSTFFQQWPQDVVNISKNEKESANIDINQLANFFNHLSEPLKAVRNRSLFFDPWEVAGLKRKEMRNTAVLAWLLDPRGTHGFGELPLKALLQIIHTSKKEIFPVVFDRHCRVQIETSPCGDSTNRVDIEIDADNFFLLIEVKIDATEQDKQIERYCLDAEKRAGKRPWAVVFLTPHGKKSLTSGSNNNHYISCLSWHHLATSLESTMQEHYQNTFMANDASFMKQMAAHAAFCFIDRMRTF